MPAPPSPLRRSVRPHAPTMGTRLSPDASAGSGSGSGSGPSSRKRVREHVAVANGEAAEPLMRDAGPDDDDEYFDVDMEAQDAYDELDASARDRGHDIDSRQNGDGLFVPYYPHFGASDFDDEDLD